MPGNIFTGDAFSNTSLTAAINAVPFLPGRIGQLGLFAEEGVPTTIIEVEELNGTLSLIPTKLRTEPASLNKADKRKIRTFKVPHIPLDDKILAGDVQDVRAFGSNAMAGVQQVVANRLVSMANKHMATHEFHRVGAVKGIVLDADGTTVLYNLFTEFGISQTTVDFVFSASTTDIRGTCTDVLDAIETALGAAVYDHVHCIAGKNWFKKFVDHDKVRDTYKNWQSNENLRKDVRFGGFTFADITFEQYRGKVGSISFVPDNEAYFFPVGVPDLFIRRNAPGNFISAANTIGMPMYARVLQEADDSGYMLKTESNPLHLCSRPASLIKGTLS